MRCWATVLRPAPRGSRKAQTVTERSSACALLWTDEVILEVTRAVGLGPETDTTFDRRPQHRVVLGNEIRVGRRAVAAGAGLAPERVLHRQLAVEPRLEVGAVDGHLQLVPRAAIEHELF